MIKPAIIIAATSLAAPALAQDTIDISGLQSWNADGDPSNESASYFLGTPDPDLGYIILTISYDITIQTFGESWLSDLNIRFGNTDGTFHGNWPDTFTPGQGDDFAGTQRYTGSFQTDIHLNDDGLFHLELFESFDDDPFAADAILMPGSTMTFGRFIPAPSGTAMLALGTVAACRRNRQS